MENREVTKKRDVLVTRPCIPCGRRDFKYTHSVYINYESGLCTFIRGNRLSVIFF